MPYTHLSAFERMEIQTLLQLGYSPAEIALEMERSVCTITRELSRNGAAQGRYSAVEAHSRYLERRRQACKAAKLSDESLRAEVEAMLMEEFSPEQIAQRLPFVFPDSPAMRVSHETIYQHVYADKRRGGKLHVHLRQRRMKRRKRGNSKGRRGVIAGRISIEDRPAIVAPRAAWATGRGTPSSARTISDPWPPSSSEAPSTPRRPSCPTSAPSPSRTQPKPH